MICKYSQLTKVWINAPNSKSVDDGEELSFKYWIAISCCVENSEDICGRSYSFFCYLSWTCINGICKSVSYDQLFAMWVDGSQYGCRSKHKFRCVICLSKNFFGPTFQLEGAYMVSSVKGLAYVEQLQMNLL